MSDKEKIKFDIESACSEMTDSERVKFFAELVPEKYCRLCGSEKTCSKLFHRYEACQCDNDE